MEHFDAQALEIYFLGVILMTELCMDFPDFWLEIFPCDLPAIDGSPSRKFCF